MRNLLYILGFCAAIACSKDAKQSDDGFPEGFMEFYERFHSDSSYQLDHISFPLPGVPALVMSGEMPENYSFSKSEWKIQKSAPDSLIAFKSIEALTDDIVEEEIGIDNSGLGIYRRFSRIGSEWYLIYYMAPNYIKNKQ